MKLLIDTGSVAEVGEIAEALGCEVATSPGEMLEAMLSHPLTESGIARFADDWKSRPEVG